MSVSLSGAVLAGLLYDQVNCNGDQEGLLLGNEINHVTDSISDSQLNNRKEEIVTYVYNYIPCNEPFTWYDHAGRVIGDKLDAVLKGHDSKEVIGWYKWRRQSSMIPSLREKAIHKALVNAFPGVRHDRFIFSLFSCSATSNLSTHSFDYIFQCQTDSSFTRLPVIVVNMKDTSQADYKLQPNYNIDNRKPNSYGKTLKKARSTFLTSSTDRLLQVDGISSLNSQLHQELTDLFTKVSSSEEILGTLTTEVEQLRERWKQKRHQPLGLRKDLIHRSKPQPESSSKADSEAPSSQLEVNGFGKAVNVFPTAYQEPSVIPSKVMRHRSKQEEISDELKDLFVTPIIAKPVELPEPHETSLPLGATKDLIKTSTAVVISSVTSLGGPGDSLIPTSPTAQKKKTKKTPYDQELTIDPLTQSPRTTRKSKSKTINEGTTQQEVQMRDVSKTKKVTAAAGGADSEISEVTKAPTKDAFDFVNNLMQDFTPKGKVGQKRNSAPVDTRSQRTRLTNTQS